MITTLSSADYFDALDRLPDPTYGETSSERLASVIAMAGSLTEEDRALVIYEPTVQPRFRAMPHGHHVPLVPTPTLSAYLVTPSIKSLSTTNSSSMTITHPCKYTTIMAPIHRETTHHSDLTIALVLAH